MSADEPVTDGANDPRAEQDAELFARLQRLVAREGKVVAAEMLGVPEHNHGVSAWLRRTAPQRGE